MVRKRKCIYGVFVILIVVIVLYGNYHVSVSRYTISSKKISAPMKIAQISDFHNSILGGRVVDVVKKEKPDVIVVTGDLIDANHPDEKRALRLLEELKAIAPVYAVSGNHEAAYNDDFSQKCDMIQNDVIQIRSDIDLIGTNDPSCIEADGANSVGKIKYMIDSMPDSDASKFSILLSHRPEAMEIYVEKGYDLVFAGHTHGGQIRVFGHGLIAPDQGFFPKYDAGIFKKKKTTMIVSRGIGNSVLPVRINNCPEIVVTELIPE